MRYLRYQGRSDAPGWLPCLLVMTTDAKTYFSIGLKSSVWCHESEVGGSQWVSRGQDDATMVDSFTVDGVRGSLESEMPFE